MNSKLLSQFKKASHQGLYVNLTDESKSIYKVLKIYDDKVNGQNIVFVVLQNVNDEQETIPVLPNQLQDRTAWKSIKGHTHTTIEKVTRLILPDGSTEVLRSEVIQDYDSKPVETKKEKTIKKQYQTIKKLNQSEQTKEDVTTESKKSEFNWSTLWGYRYHNLDVIGLLLRDNEQLINYVTGGFKSGITRAEHEQTYDRFREGNITIKNLSKESVSSTHRKTGLSPQMIIYRIAKHIYHYGTPTEREKFDF